jgi:hypothetical protein
MLHSNDENVNPLTTEIYESIASDLQAHSNHFLRVDVALTKKIDKITCLCSKCSIIKDEVTKLSKLLHDEVVYERMRDITYVTNRMKSLATEICDKFSKSTSCLWNK